MLQKKKTPKRKSSGKSKGKKGKKGYPAKRPCVKPVSEIQSDREEDSTSLPDTSHPDSPLHERIDTGIDAMLTLNMSKAKAPSTLSVAGIPVQGVEEEKQREGKPISLFPPGFSLFETSSIRDSVPTSSPSPPSLFLQEKSPQLDLVLVQHDEEEKPKEDQLHSSPPDDSQYTKAIVVAPRPGPLTVSTTTALQRRERHALAMPTPRPAFIERKTALGKCTLADLKDYVQTCSLPLPTPVTKERLVMIITTQIDQYSIEEIFDAPQQPLPKRGRPKKCVAPAPSPQLARHMMVSPSVNDILDKANSKGMKGKKTLLPATLFTFFYSPQLTGIRYYVQSTTITQWCSVSTKLWCSRSANTCCFAFTTTIYGFVKSQSLLTIIYSCSIPT